MNKHRSGTLLLRVAPSHRRPVSRGYTFLELIVGMIATGALVAGTTAAIAVAMQTVRIAQAPNSLVKCSEVLEELAGQLTLADVVWNAGSMELVCNLVDIDGDGRRDHVRYWWSGIAGSPLWRSLNGGPRESVTPSVASFRVDYQTESPVWRVDRWQTSDELLLDTHSSIVKLSDVPISASEQLSQHVDPQRFTLALPADAVLWRPTRILFVAQSVTPADSMARVSLCPSTSVWQTTTAPLAQATVLESSLSGFYSLVSLPFPETGRWLGATEPAAIRFSGLDADPAAKLLVSGQGQGAFISTDGGRVWYEQTDTSVLFSLYGRYQRRETAEVTRPFVRSATLSLQLSGGSQALQRDVSMPNAPPYCANHFAADFSFDPRSIDLNGDAEPDWSLAPSGFAVSSLPGGIWEIAPGDSLRSRSSDALSGLVTLNVRAQATTSASGGLQVTLNVGRSASQSRKVAVELIQTQDGSQAAALYQVTETGRDLLSQIPGLPAGFRDLQLIVHGTDDWCQWSVDGVDVGMFPISPTTSAPLDDAILCESTGGNIQIDSIWCEVAAP